MMNGMTREATQELGRWKPPSVMERVYSETKPEEGEPDMRWASD